MRTPVIDFVRMCQYVDPTTWAKCSNLAHTTTYVKFYPNSCGGGDYRSFRCLVHEGWVDDDRGGPVMHFIASDGTFSLGYDTEGNLNQWT